MEKNTNIRNKPLYYKDISHYEVFIDLIYYISEKYGSSEQNIIDSKDILLDLYKFIRFIVKPEYDKQYNIIIHTSEVENYNFNNYYKKFEEVHSFKHLKDKKGLIIFICANKYKPKYKNYLLPYDEEVYTFILMFCILVTIYHEYSYILFIENNPYVVRRPLDNPGNAFYYTVTYTNTELLRIINLYSLRLRCIFEQEYILKKMKDIINLIKTNIYG